METGPAALVLFFGLFWGFAQGLFHPYKLYDLPHLFNRKYRKHAFRRFLVGLLLVDLAPLAFLWLLYVVVVPDNSGGLAVVSAAISAHSVFGILRVLHAFIASDATYRLFYSENEYLDVAGEWIQKESNSFHAHIIPGIAYLIAFPAIGYVVGRLGQ